MIKRLDQIASGHDAELEAMTREELLELAKEMAATLVLVRDTYSDLLASRQVIDETRQLLNSRRILQ